MRASPERDTDIERLKAFSDGVFAIAITLLVLEIHIPHLPHDATAAQLRVGLAALWPSYFAYVFSFVTVGIYWANHYHIFKIYKACDHGFILLNILFLMCISFLPFPTEVLGEHLLNPALRQTAILFYIFGLWLPAVCWALKWVYGSTNYRLIDTRIDPSFVAFSNRQYLISNIAYITAFVVALFNAWAGLVIALSQTFLYLLPPKRPTYRTEPDEPASGTRGP